MGAGRDQRIWVLQEAVSKQKQLWQSFRAFTLHRREAEPLKLQALGPAQAAACALDLDGATQRYNRLTCLPQSHLLTVSTLLPTGFRLSCSMTIFVRPVSTYSQKA